METKAVLKSVGIDYDTNEVNITFSCSREFAEFCKEKQKKPFTLTAKTYTEKRSLNANAYCWLLIEQIAKAIKSSKTEVYEKMLKDFGTFDTIGLEPIQIKVAPIVDISVIEGHWMETGIDSDGMYIYTKVKGSSEYDTKEMAHFIEGVVSTAQELNIQTLTPNEIERLKACWQYE